QLVVWALRDVTLSLRDGDRVAIIGRNGAGKSTLIKVMAGIYEPPVGSVSSAGKVASITDVTLGMDFEATGYENIRLCGTIIGLSNDEIEKFTPEIARFTELGDHLHLPVRTYSSGMALRLAFAICSCASPEILIMDELISTGDVHFMGKARQRLFDMMSRARILVVASHQTDILYEVCHRAVWMDGGRVMADGPVADVLKEYEKNGLPQKSIA
ncbi:MAG: ABC transporter ATP-binding protein, partial [Alphaproteobacteria bacterium]|nr:ABC transporter ATP-binding protein [Alphaproteobacteria bacterium]